MTRLVCLDLETTGVDIESCEIVQFGAIEVDTEKDPKWVGESKSMLCQPHKPIPAEATEVHGITDNRNVYDQRVSDGLHATLLRGDEPHFSQIAASVFDWIGDARVVTFNGEGYDLPILERFTNTKTVEDRFRLVVGWRPQRSIDVMRLWNFMRRTDTSEAPANVNHSFPLSVMTGSLSAAHHWCSDIGIDGAHDALNDCRATLDVLWAFVAGCEAGSGVMHASDWSLDDCERMTREPLPGDVDWAGKLKWSGEEIVFSFGKHKGRPVSSEPGYISWMLKSDFHESTVKILREIQRGRYPKREQT